MLLIGLTRIDHLRLYFARAVGWLQTRRQSGTSRRAWRGGKVRLCVLRRNQELGPRTEPVTQDAGVFGRPDFVRSESGAFYLGQLDGQRRPVEGHTALHLRMPLPLFFHVKPAYNGGVAWMDDLPIERHRFRVTDCGDVDLRQLWRFIRQARSFTFGSGPMRGRSSPRIGRSTAAPQSATKNRPVSMARTAHVNGLFVLPGQYSRLGAVHALGSLAEPLEPTGGDHHRDLQPRLANRAIL